MKLNRRKLNIILPQIKAHLNVAVMQDNQECPGLIDFIFQPKSREIELGYLNRLTCGMGGRDGLFGDTAVEVLGKPILVNIARLRDALKGGESEPELKDGTVNGISILAGIEDSKTAGMGRAIDACKDSIKDGNLPGSVEFVMPRIDYELMANTVGRFVSQDPVQYSMCGYDIDFGKGEDFINFAATDGRRLALCKFPYKHPRLGDGKDSGGNFIFKPLTLFIPGSVYSRVQWQINDDVSRICIQTEDYRIDCWAKSIEGRFPNYIRVIPDKELNREWMAVNARSARNAYDSIKGLIGNSVYSLVKNQVLFDAEDPKRIKLTVPGASVDIDGEASRPMCLRAGWDYIESCFFDTPVTKFMLQNVEKPVLAEEARAVRGTTMTITKIVMPIAREDNTDEWGIADLTKIQVSGGENCDPEDGFGEDEEEENSAIQYGDSPDDVF